MGRVGRTAAALVIALLFAVGLGCADHTALTLTSIDVSSGPRSGYQNVTIHGTDFTGVEGVSFGSTKAVDFTVADPTQIVAVVPPGDLGAVVDVTVTASGATSTLRGAYTYWDYDLKLINGGTTKAYTLDEIKAMAPVTGYWGAINDKPYNTDQYRGVPLLTLVEAVGGWSKGEEILVKSADGFTATYTSAMLEQMAGGTYPMWDATGVAVVTDDRFAQPLVAYEIDTSGDGDDWQSLTAGKGPFRVVAATASADRLSQGPANPALAVSIEVREESALSTVSTVTSLDTTTVPSAGLSLDPASGPRSGYQNVTIHGSGFDGATAVSFGLVKAVHFTVVDSSRIVAVTPAGDLGSVVDVIVTTAKGKTTLPHAYTYWDYDLKLIKSGTTKTYTLDQIKAMAPVTGFWGAHKDPLPYNTDQYRGVPILTLLDAVGGWSEGEEITVTSADDFSITYTTEMLKQMADGTYPMWNANGTPVINNERFGQLIVAYEIDAKGDGSTWGPIEAGTGPLRIALITAESDRVNQGKYNPFLAMSIEVTSP